MRREHIQTLLQPTLHSLTRQARRNLSDQDIEFVVARGRYIYCAGALHIFLRRRDIPKNKDINDRFARLEGTVLVINVQHATPILITVYRNRNSFKQIRSKAKYDVRRRHSSHPHRYHGRYAIEWRDPDLQRDEHREHYQAVGHLIARSYGSQYGMER